MRSAILAFVASAAFFAGVVVGAGTGDPSTPPEAIALTDERPVAPSPSPDPTPDAEDRIEEVEGAVEDHHDDDSGKDREDRSGPGSGDDSGKDREDSSGPGGGDDSGREREDSSGPGSGDDGSGEDGDDGGGHGKG